MRFGKAALAGGRRRDRQLERFRQLQQRLVGLGDADPVAGDDDRTLGRAQRLRGCGHLPAFGRRRQGRQVERRRIEPRAGIGAYGAGEGADAVEHRDRTRLARQRVLDGELRRDHGLDRLERLENLLRHAGEAAPRVPGAVVASAGLVGSMQGIGRGVAEIG
jgi:hypothetical protein